MKKLPYILFLFIFSQVSILSGQEIGETWSCHTKNSTKSHIEITTLPYNTDPKIVNVFLHVIRRNNGSQGLTTAEINDNLALLRNDYIAQNIYIREIGRDFIDNTTFYIGMTHTNYNELINTNNHDNAIDVYFLAPNDDYSRSAGIPSSAMALGGYYSGTSVLSHEFGHCLGLYHTHSGSGCDDYENCMENKNGSNCLDCGDLICDTPADPCLRGNVNVDCEYIGGNGYEPDVENIMSYAPPECLSHLTYGQRDRLHNIITNSEILQNLSYKPTISGPSSFCTSSVATFTLQEYPSGSVINWTKSNNLEILSSSGATYKVKRISSGTACVQAVISFTGLNEAVTIRKYVSDGRPIISDYQIRGGYDNVTYNSTDVFYITAASGASSYSWSIVPYSMNCSSNKLPYFIGSNTGTSVHVKHGTCSGKYMLKCKATNGCGSVYYQDKVINVYNSSGGSGDPDPCATVMSIYPNPGKKTDYTTLQIQYPDDPCDDNPEAYSQAENEIKLHDMSGNLVHQETFSSDTYMFKNANFKNGIYIVTIKDKKGEMHQKRLQIK